MLLYYIRLFHILLILLIVISVVINNKDYKKYILIFLIYLLFQYLTGLEHCGLTKLEYLVMGENYKNGFLYRIINPLIKIPEIYFDKYLFIFHLIYIIILFIQIFMISS